MTVGHGTRAESLLKTVTWYLSDSVLTGIVSFVVTRDVRTALGIAGLQQTTELLLYYFHERVWVRVQARRESGNADGQPF
jgi:uncharacterized membrane protein